MDGKNATNNITPSITLSPFTEALIKNYRQITKRLPLNELSRINVSQTVSFFAIVYEKIRNAVEYREEHLIRRAAIERILKRRLLLNSQGTGEAENLIRELLWARYFPNGSLGASDVQTVQQLIDQYVVYRKTLVVGQVDTKKIYYNQFLFDLLTCEIEESLAPDEAQKNLLFTSFIFQVLRKKIKIDGTNEMDKDAFFYTAIERTYAKSDEAYLRFHIFNLTDKQIFKGKSLPTEDIVAKLPEAFTRIDKIINSPNIDKLAKYAKTQIPSFVIFFNILERNKDNIEEIIRNKDKLWSQVDSICREKYQQTSSRLRGLAVRSLIYIFLTKMVFALILEYPLSMYFYGEVSLTSIGINSIFPPILMLIIISFVRVPGEDNTKKIYESISDLVNAASSFDTSLAYVVSKPRVRKPLLIFGFTIFYSLTFLITLTLIYEALTFLKFNLISQIIFIFFVSVVSFFGFRVRQIAKEFRLQTKESFFSPFVDFFFIPILSLGKFFSNEISKLNFFIVIFDYLIEAPFKFIFEIVEEWIAFVRARKEEII